MNDMRLRMASPEDARSLLKIYAPYVEHTNISFEYEVPSTDEFSKRISEVTAKYPYLVCELDAVPVGYAYALRYRARAAYAWSVETSVYLAPQAQHRGIGKALYAALFELLQKQGVYMVYACVSGENASSQSFHLAQGFEQVGVTKNVGFKRGQWLNTTCYEKQLLPLSTPPLPFVPLGELEQGTVCKILNKYF